MRTLLVGAGSVGGHSGACWGSQFFFGKRPLTLAIYRLLRAERVGALERDSILKLSVDPIPVKLQR